MLTNYFPHTADIDGRWLIFYDRTFALARVELHEDQEPEDGSLLSRLGTENVVDIFPDDWEGDHMLVRVKPETLRVFERGVIPDRGDEQIYFDREKSIEFLLDDFPALKVEAYRRAYLDAVTRWDREVASTSQANPDVTNDELPPQPVFEPARSEWEAWQAALAERDALYERLDRELTPEARKQGRPALNAEQCAAVDTISKKIQIRAEA
ncbi:hypothetical protein [Bradyrhizobium zhanjiangense]|uniref:Uncharacterized protein n=1 Tax=Bradyrhizobium zhanjiangense TaxID=1325107 RepID=A0A4Q0SNP1_9BRAD|nr:hypothetical protein [Bradyrhizobium zhanjiangense]RXH41307.1 hypothetical protein XH94_08980 [Bradyrhizobium zhanjiangense]